MKATRPSGSRPTFALRARGSSPRRGRRRGPARRELAGEEQRALAGPGAEVEDALGRRRDLRGGGRERRRGGRPSPRRCARPSPSAARSKKRLHRAAQDRPQPRRVRDRGVQRPADQPRRGSESGRGRSRHAVMIASVAVPPRAVRDHPLACGRCRAGAPSADRPRRAIVAAVAAHRDRDLRRRRRELDRPTAAASRDCVEVDAPPPKDDELQAPRAGAEQGRAGGRHGRDELRQLRDRRSTPRTRRRRRTPSPSWPSRASTTTRSSTGSRPAS